MIPWLYSIESIVSLGSSSNDIDCKTANGKIKNSRKLLTFEGSDLMCGLGAGCMDFTVELRESEANSLSSESTVRLDGVKVLCSIFKCSRAVSGLLLVSTNRGLCEVNLRYLLPVRLVVLCAPWRFLGIFGIDSSANFKTWHWRSGQNPCRIARRRGRQNALLYEATRRLTSFAESWSGGCSARYPMADSWLETSTIDRETILRPRGFSLVMAWNVFPNE